MTLGQSDVTELLDAVRAGAVAHRRSPAVEGEMLAAVSTGIGHATPTAAPAGTTGSRPHQDLGLRSWAVDPDRLRPLSPEGVDADAVGA